MKKTFIILWLCSLPALTAGTITFASEGSSLDHSEYNSEGNNLAISGHPGWASPLPGSSWISYAQTGDPNAPGYFMPANGLVVSFFQALNLPWVPTSGTVTYLADDSAALYVNGVLVQPEATTVNNTYSHCSDFTPGCLTTTQVTVNLQPYLQKGTNTLRFDVAQHNSVSFGLDYSGSATGTLDVPTSDTPEPTTWALIGLGLTAISFLKRK